jgi:glycosyltransferase involved in cell wall biosynthesis
MNNSSFMQSKNRNLIKRHETGVILHLYYPEMWREILSYLDNLEKDFDLFVTVPQHVDFSENQITSHFPDANIYRCENRGRDVAPFLAVYSLISNLGYRYLCKIHTKRDTTIGSAASWRQDMLQKLLGSPGIIRHIKTAFDQRTDWGMVAPEGHVVPYNYFWSNNAARVTELARSVGISTDKLDFSYVAGTMFWFRPEAFQLILKANIDFQEFASEQGQKDATLAHALERFFGLATVYSGYKIAESDAHEIRQTNVTLHFRALSGFYENLLQENQALRARVLRLERMKSIGSVEEENRNLRLTISSIYASSSWRITQPLRDAKTFSQKVSSHSRMQIKRTKNLILHAFPRTDNIEVQGNNAPQTKQSVDSSSPAPKPPAIPFIKQSKQTNENETNPAPDSDNQSKKLPTIKKPGGTYKISVVVTSYNHEKYISKCLDGILMQRGVFDLEVILGDDCSTDLTPQIMQNYQEKYPDIIKIMPAEVNLGVTRNLKRCLDACTGEFVAICEGDDYWISEEKLQKQMKHLIEHQDLPMCFSSIMLLYEPANRLVPHPEQYVLNKDRISTEEIIQTNYIGNFSCCMYRMDVIRELPHALFEIYTVDWMFNIMCSEWGGIGYIKDWMSVYRIHSSGGWSGKPEQEKYESWLSYIDTYNSFLDFKYDKEFKKLKSQVEELLFQAQTH